MQIFLIWFEKAYFDFIYFFYLIFSKMFGIRFGFSKACLSFFVFGKTEQSNSFTVTLSPKHLPVISLFWVWVVWALVASAVSASNSAGSHGLRANPHVASSGLTKS